MKKKPRPSLKPKRLTSRAWWYEDKGGIQVIHQPETITAHIRITWGELLKAAKRCGSL